MDDRFSVGFKSAVEAVLRDLGSLRPSTEGGVLTKKEYNKRERGQFYTAVNAFNHQERGKPRPLGQGGRARTAQQSYPSNERPLVRQPCDTLRVI